MRNVVILIMLVVWALVMNQSLHNQNKQLHDTLEKITAGHENIVAQEHETQSKIIEEGKNTVLENNNKSTKSFMFVPKNGNTMRTNTKKEIINFAGEHGWAVSLIENDRGIVFEKRNEGM